MGAVAWEGIEVVLDAMGAQISHAPVDTFVDVGLGMLGGAAGSWMADRYLDRLFGRSRVNPKSRVR